MTDEISQVPIEDLIPYARNARTHSDEQVAQIAASIREFGFNNPVLLRDDNTIVAGHGRVLAARKLSMDAVPCIYLSHLSDTQARAYVIADNKLALNAGWDEELLNLELGDLADEGFNLDLTGFDVGEIEELAARDGVEVVEDDVPEPPVDPITKHGDLWLLGDHRLLCGDSTKAEDVERLMAGAKADLCFTSPPYGQQRDYTEEGKAQVADWDSLMRGVFGNLRLSEDAQVLVNLGLIHRENEWVPYWDGWIDYMRKNGWRRFGLYVWDQMAGLMGNWNGRLGPSFEFVFHFNKVSIQPQKFVATKESSRKQKKKGAPGQRAKDGTVKKMYSLDKTGQDTKIPDSVIRISRNATIDMARNSHPATFPIQLPAFILECWKGSIYDPFLGSGTTLIAAEQLGRKCYGMEISPQYCDVIVKRWETLTGKKAERV